VYALWRSISLLTTILNRLLVLAVGAALLHDFLFGATLGSVSSSWFAIALQWCADHRRVAIGCGIGLVLLNLNVVQFLLFTLVNRPGRAFIESKTPGGQSRIALGAIQSALAATALQVPEISRSRIRVLKLGANRYRVHIRYFVRNVAEAGNAAEHLRLVLKKRFSDLVVLDPKDRVEFDLDLAGIDGLRTRLPARRELAKPTEDPRDPSFKGPIYPVDGES